MGITTNFWQLSDAGAARVLLAIIEALCEPNEKLEILVVELRGIASGVEIRRSATVESMLGCHTIPRGTHDNALTSLAGFLRGPLRLSESAIAHALWAVMNCGVLDQDPCRPYTIKDAERIAHSIASKPVGAPSFEIAPPKPSNAPTIGEINEALRCEVERLGAGHESEARSNVERRFGVRLSRVPGAA